MASRQRQIAPRSYPLWPTYTLWPRAHNWARFRPIRAWIPSSEHSAREMETWKADTLPTELLPLRLVVACADARPTSTMATIAERT